MISTNIIVNLAFTTTITHLTAHQVATSAFFQIATNATTNTTLVVAPSVSQNALRFTRFTPQFGPNVDLSSSTVMSTNFLVSSASSTSNITQLFLLVEVRALKVAIILEVHKRQFLSFLRNQFHQIATGFIQTNTKLDCLFECKGSSMRVIEDQRRRLCHVYRADPNCV